MTDYEILTSLMDLEIDRHNRVVHALENARITISMLSTKANLREEVAAEIAWRKERVVELRSRRKRFNAGIQERRRGVKSRGDAGWVWRKFG